MTEKPALSGRLERLMKIKVILDSAFGSWPMVYKPFTIQGSREDEYKLTFSCDTYFEPIFMMFVFQDYGVLKFKIEYAGSETDRVVISDGSVEVLEKLNKIVDWQKKNDLENILIGLGCKKIPREPETGPIIIDEIEKQYVVSRGRWNAYWASKGQTGPTSAWEMPTYATIMATTASYIDEK